MMSLYEVIEKHGANKGKEAMWDSLRLIDDYVEDLKEYDADGYDKLIKGLYEVMCGKHFDECFAREQIEKMYYCDSRGLKHYAPYWSDADMRDTYERVRTLIPSCYSEYDFWVAFSMLKSDYHNLIESWFGDKEDEKLLEMVVSYFNDPDAPSKDSKIWDYFN